MKVYVGIDLGSTTTKAVMIDEGEQVLGRGITNSRSNYELAAAIARDEARVSARFTLLERELGEAPELARFRTRLAKAFRKQQSLTQLAAFRDLALEEAGADRVAAIRAPLTAAVRRVLDGMKERVEKPSLLEGGAPAKTSDFFRDRAAADYAKLAEQIQDRTVRFDDLMGIFDKAILRVENTELDLSFAGNVGAAIEEATRGLDPSVGERGRGAVLRVAEIPLDVGCVIGTGYGRQTLPFPREDIRSEILCHGLGAHHQFPLTRTVLDIGGQDTKAIQVDGDGVVTSFQMNDRCAAGCGRYLGYIADEMSLGVHELGPIALESTRTVKINSTCTVFAGAELRDHLSNGQRREDILAGLHRAIILRAMALLARSGGVEEELTFTGGVANNPAAVEALRALVRENYGERTLNISPGSIYTGALGAALFGRRGLEARELAA
ncbi:MAG: hypothetical protein KF729_01025 [Sandaracinaceae bacterium]|nr:hypothetical protein [Sandaracinaceae bacterium]